MSTKDLVKKFHSLAPTSPVNGLSSCLPKADSTCDSSNNTSEHYSKNSSTSNSAKAKKPKKHKEKRRPKLSSVDENVVDSLSLSYFIKDQMKGKCFYDAISPTSSVFIHGYGAIPVIKGDFQLMPKKAKLFVAEKAVMMQPAAIAICDGSFFEFNALTEEMAEETHQLKRLTGSGSSVFLARSDPEDTKHIGKCMVITTKKRSTTESKGNAEKKLTNWMSAYRFRLSLAGRFPGCMRGRVMFIIPFSMGPIGSYNSMNGIQLTDSPYIAAQMHLMTRVSAAVWDAIGNSDFIKCIHSVGLPKPCTSKLVHNWSCNIEKTFVGHWIELREIWSFGSNVVENALLAKECLALRMASAIGREEGWLAEHMAIISFTNPDGKEFFIGVASPPGVGKTTFATMKPSLMGWKVQMLGDDVAWLKFDETDGKMYAMNPENGVYGLAVGVNKQHNPDLLGMLGNDTIFTNVAETSDGRAWWQRIGEELPDEVSITNWHGKNLGFLTKPILDVNVRRDVSTNEGNVIASPSARFAARLKQYPNLHKQWDDPKGVPLSAILFCSRRKNGVPLVTESMSWSHGVFVAASLRSENCMKILQHDPMGIRSAMGYNFAHYIQHWLNMETAQRRMPRIFFTNLYRRDAESDQLLWPGFEENIRIVDWITRRLSDLQDGGSSMQIYECADSPFGKLANKGDFNLEGLDKLDWQQLMSVSNEFWSSEYNSIKEFFFREMGEEVPQKMLNELEAMRRRLDIEDNNNKS